MATGTTSTSVSRAYRARWTESMGTQLLVVDPCVDDGILGSALAGRGVHVTWTSSILEGLVAFGRIDPSAVVVATDAPGMPVPAFVSLIREHGSPYVIAGLPRSASGGGLPAGPDPIGPLLLAGASGVVLRPYEPEELWRVLGQSPRTLVEHARLVVGPLELDAAAFTVRVHGQRIADLPLKEFELLRALMIAAPEVLTDDELRDALWGETQRRPRSNTVAMHVARLRSRLGSVAVVRRVRGRGYSLAVDVA